MYSRQIRNLDTKNMERALNVLLNQLNLVQDESARKIEQLEAEIKKLKTALEGQGGN